MEEGIDICKWGNLRKINAEGFKKHLKWASQNKQAFNIDRQKYTINEAFFFTTTFISSPNFPS